MPNSLFNRFYSVLACFVVIVLALGLLTVRASADTEEDLVNQPICHQESTNDEENLVLDSDRHENNEGCSHPKESADLSITKNVDEPTPNIGGVVTFGLSVTNNGPSTAHNVVVNDALPGQFDFISSDPTSAYDAQSGVWNIGDLVNGQTVYLDILAQAKFDAGDTNPVNTATVTSTTQDVNLQNNTAKVTVEIGIPQKPVCVEGENYASRVIFHIRGVLNNGNGITDPNVTNSNDSLNSPDNKYVSLGKNGIIKLGFANFVMNVPGDDFKVFEVNSGEQDPTETAKVEISQDGEHWFVVGTASNSNPSGETAFDISETGLSWFEFIKISDTTNFNEQPENANGFDLDAVGLEYQSCVVGTLVKRSAYNSETREIEYTLTWGLYGQGNLDLNLVDPVPSGTTYIPESASDGGVYNSEEKEITWGLGNHAGGDTGSVTFKVTVNENYFCDINNTASLNWLFIANDENNPGFTKASVSNTLSENSGNECGGGETGGQTNTGSITGVVFNDGNSNTVMDEGEAQLSGWVVYLDTNDNGNLDSGEPTKTTASPYVFSNLADGTYTVREVVQDGWSQTLPTSPDNFKYTVTISGGAAVTGKNFGNYQRPGGGSIGASSVADGGTTGGNGGGSSSGNGNGSNGAGTPQVLGDSTGTGLQMPEAQPKVLGATELPRTGVPLWVYLVMIMLVSSLVAIPTVTSQVKKSAVKI